MSNKQSPLSGHLYLPGIESFFQYEIDGRLVTVIGEEHMSGYVNCPEEPSITVANLMVRFAKTNPMNKLLLEFIPNRADLCPFIGSKNIADTYKASVESKTDNQLIGFDIRSLLLRSVDQDVLYHEPRSLSKLDSSVVAKVYIEPISSNNMISNKLLLDNTLYTKDQYTFLNVTYLNDLIAHANYAKNQLASWDTGDKMTIITTIRDLWKKVADYAIIKEIFISTGKQRGGNIVVLCGYNHAHNLHTVFRRFGIVGKSKKNSVCVDIIGALL